MASIDFYICGAPSDNETLSNNNDEFVKQFFNRPNSSYSVDFDVEALPEKKSIYYTFGCYKDVDGYNRSGSYLTLTLRMMEVYCSDIRGIYQILDTVYRNFIVGKMVSKNGMGVKYKIDTLSSFENDRLKIEKYLVDYIQSLMPGKLISFDSSFSKDRLQANLGISAVSDYENERLVEELKRTHKLHLIPDVDKAKIVAEGTKKKLSEYEAQLRIKDDEISKAKGNIDLLEREKQDLENKNASYYKSIQDKDMEISNLSKKYDELEKDPSVLHWNTVVNKLVELEGKINGLQQLKGGSGKHKNKKNNYQQWPNDQTVSSSNEHKEPPRQNEQNDQPLMSVEKILKRSLPWILFFVTLIVLLFTIWLKPSGKSEIRQLEQQKQYLKQTISNQEAQIKELQSTIIELKGSSVAKIQGVEKDGGISETQEQPHYIDIDCKDANKLKIGKRYKVMVKSKGGKRDFPGIEWRIVSGDRNASKPGMNLIAKQRGM